MKQTLFFLILFFYACGNDRSVSDSNAIYGEDDRQDLYEFGANSVEWELADSVGLIVDREHLIFHPKGLVEAKFETLAEAQASIEERLNPKVRFRDQLVLPGATGFLIGDGILATAGHVLDEDNCESNVVIFNFSLKAKGEPTSRFIDRYDIYDCKKVLLHEMKYLPDHQIESDIAIVKLDRTTMFRPNLKLSREPLATSSLLWAIGHPSGLPMKVAKKGKVRKLTTNYALTTLDMFAGNSGSPVLDRYTKEVVGILSRGDSDYTMPDDADYTKPVWYAKKCREHEKSSDPKKWDCSGEAVALTHPLMSRISKHLPKKCGKDRKRQQQRKKQRVGC